MVASATLIARVVENFMLLVSVRAKWCNQSVDEMSVLNDCESRIVTRLRLGLYTVKHPAVPEL